MKKVKCKLFSIRGIREYTYDLNGEYSSGFSQAFDKYTDWEELSEEDYKSLSQWVWRKNKSNDCTRFDSEHYFLATPQDSKVALSEMVALAKAENEAAEKRELKKKAAAKKREETRKKNELKKKKEEYERLKKVFEKEK